MLQDTQMRGYNMYTIDILKYMYRNIFNRKVAKFIVLFYFTYTPCRQANCSFNDIFQFRFLHISTHTHTYQIGLFIYSEHAFIFYSVLSQSQSTLRLTLPEHCASSMCSNKIQIKFNGTPMPFIVLPNFSLYFALFQLRLVFTQQLPVLISLPL